MKSPKLILVSGILLLISGCSTTGFAPVRSLLCGPAPVLKEHRKGDEGTNRSRGAVRGTIFKSYDCDK